MALFASSRDISMIRRVNKELIKNIISQEIDYYQLALQETDLNVYGESPAGKTYLSAVRIACLILREDQTWTVDDQFGSNITQTIQLQFNRDILTEANLIPIVGDIVNWNGHYWEIDNIIENQLFGGKDPDYTKNVGPEFGSSISMLCGAHYTKITQVQIEESRGGV